MKLFALPSSFSSAVAPGVYTVQQRTSGRFLDAHEIASKDFAVVTRPSQGNDTQRWVFTPVGGIYTLQQGSNGRFVDAHEAGHDFGVVTRPPQGNDTQLWVLQHLGGEVFIVKQLSSGRFVDAHQSASKDFAVVTRPLSPFGSASRHWIMKSIAKDRFTIQQESSKRFLDAHEIAEKDFQLVTRPAQNNETQRWIVSPVATICEIQQLSSRRFLDAHDNADHDFAAVTRERQNDDTQRWLVRAVGGGRFSLQQISGDRFLDAHEIQAKDFAAVTRSPHQTDGTQDWGLSVQPHVDLAAFDFNIQSQSGSSFSATGIVHNVGQLPVKGPFKVVLGVTTASGTRQLETNVPATTTILAGAIFFTDPIRDIPKSPGTTCLVEMQVDPQMETEDALRGNNSLSKELMF